MRIKSLAHKNQMGKKKTTNASTSWVSSEFAQSDLTKAQKDGVHRRRGPGHLPQHRTHPQAPERQSGDVPRLSSLRPILSCTRVSLRASLCLRRAASPGHAKLNFTHCLLCHSLQIFLGDRAPLDFWKFLFRLRPSVALSKKPELGGAVVSIRAEVHYLEFNMVALVQGWRKKWFYIKDQKNSSSDQYGIAPFDANKDLKKLSSWDSPPMEVEMEDIKPLLAHIQALKSGSGGALSRTHLMSFFL
jgi:hypothetical protein